MIDALREYLQGEERSRWSGPIVVNDITLPRSYADFLRSEKADRDFWWNLDKSHWYSMFPKEEIEHPFLWSYRLMAGENRRWITENREMFLGTADGLRFPGALNPKTSLLIGELGTDAVIALDFSTSLAEPSVCYLMWYQDALTRWISAVPDVDTLLRNLGALS